jgi:adenylate cyclase
MRLLLKQLLEHDGYQTLEADSGEAALQQAEQTAFAAILLDYQMTGIDGIETCRRLRVMEKHKVTPILIITVADESEVLDTAFTAGCDDYLVKPIKHVVLHARLQAHIYRTELYYQLEQVRKMLNRYISPRTQLMVEQYAGTGQLPPPARREVCVLFTDIRGFTQLSQQVTPEYLFTTLSQHLAEQVELVYQYSGYVDKYAGDGIMAIFEGPDMAHRACLCALDIIQHAHNLISTEANLLFAVGCGINQGPAVIGNIGSPEHLDYSVVGETVNLASRLCDLAEPMSIVVSEGVCTGIGTHPRLHFSESRQVEVKGFAQAVAIRYLLPQLAA